MHTVTLLKQAISVAEQLGYSIRYESLGSIDGGACEFGGQKWIFLDLTLNASEQLEQVSQALEQDAAFQQALQSKNLLKVAS